MTLIHFPAQPQEHPLTRGSSQDQPSGELTWFAVCVGFRAEYRVCEALREGRFERYCPSERKFATHGRKKEPKSYPLFPGYVFVGLEPVTHGPFGAEFPFDVILGMEDVTGFVAFGGRPRPIGYDAVPAVIPRPGSVGASRPPRTRARSLSEVRAMEETGAFDHTLDAKAAANVRKARKSIRGFAGLAAAMARDGRERAPSPVDPLAGWPGSCLGWETETLPLKRGY